MNFTHLLVRRASLAIPKKRQLLQVSGQAFGRYDFERAITHAKFGILSFRPQWRNLFLFRAVARDYSFWVYILTNRNHSVRYIGVTNSLSRRSWQHREGTGAAFPAAYRCTKLIYYEHYRDIRAAIARETQLKKWSRAKKVALINRLNPRWMDIGDQVLGE